MTISVRCNQFFQKACQGFLEIDCHDGLKNAIVSETKTVYFEPRTQTNENFKGQVDLKAELVHTKSQNKLKCTFD